MSRDFLRDELSAFGASGQNIRWLDGSSADNIEYYDLVDGVGLNWERTQKVALSAVVEFEQRPLLYVLRADAMSSGPGQQTAQLQALRGKLACRGDRAWLAVLTPGQLTVYPVGLSPSLPTPVAISHADGNAHLFVQDLISGRREDLQRNVEQRSFHDLLFKLVTDANRGLLKLPALEGKTDIVLSLVGRALFARFLIDRSLMNSKSFPAFAGDFQTCFSTAKKAAQVCKWQDETFNGELLPLVEKNYGPFFRELENECPEAFNFLSTILYHAPDGQLLIKETWAHVDFAHVPIGLLSEVYEQFAHDHGPEKPKTEEEVEASKKKRKKKSLAAAESIHYTPRNIAAYMLDQAWPALTCEPHEARLLDPSAGGGVFLGLAYRRLIAEKWKTQSHPLTRKQLRDILYQQIRGMDINISALRLAALSLYLTALELDPSPQDFTDMRFDPMIESDSVLVHVRKKDEPHPNPNILGSLGDAVPKHFINHFDLVIGNPPWTSWEGEEGTALNKQAQKAIRKIASERSARTQSPTSDILTRTAKEYKNPDLVPDLPFAWKAMEWAKADTGIISYAMHARLLFKRSGPGADAREALFNAVRVTGVLNGTALRMEKVWPNVQAQWCLLFAVNQVPTPDSAFYFVSPLVEPSLNDSGLMRIDYDNASPVTVGGLNQQPELLKALFRGTPADSEVLRLMTKHTVGLQEFWDKFGLKNGIGLQTTSDEESSVHLKGMPYLSSTKQAALELDVSKLPKFELDNVHRAREEAIYAGPMVIIPQAVDVSKGRKSYLSQSDCVYNRSFIGFSSAGYAANGVDASSDLARYIFLLTQSSFLVYYGLMTSAQYGIERDTLLKEDIDRFPVPLFDELEPSAIEEMRALYARWVKGQASLDELDGWASQQYGLRKRHIQCVKDALATNGPGEARSYAPPTQAEVEAFVSELRQFLQQYFDEPCEVTLAGNNASQGSWLFLDVITGNTAKASWVQQWVTALADHSGATRITLPLAQGHIGIALVNQYRYWTRTKAYLCGLHILRTFGTTLSESTP